MAVIAVLKPTEEGGWEGPIRTLHINRRVRFVPNDNRKDAASPAFRILAGRSELGVAWATRSSRQGRSFLRVELDDPNLPASISAALFEIEEKAEAHLVWKRWRSE